MVMFLIILEIKEHEEMVTVEILQVEMEVIVEMEVVEILQVETEVIVEMEVVKKEVKILLVRNLVIQGLRDLVEYNYHILMVIL